jgi:hypothetical protein
MLFTLNLIESADAPRNIGGIKYSNASYLTLRTVAVTLKNELDKALSPQHAKDLCEVLNTWAVIFPPANTVTHWPQNEGINEIAVDYFIPCFVIFFCWSRLISASD